MFGVASGSTGRKTPRRKRCNATARRATAKDNATSATDRGQKFIPGTRLPYGALGLAENRVWPALLGTLRLSRLGALGLRRAYRSTVRFYQGETVARPAPPWSRQPQPRPPARPKAGGPYSNFVCPWCPKQAAAVAWAPSFRCSGARSEDGLGIGVHRDGGSRRVGILAAAPKILPWQAVFIVTGAMAFSLFMLCSFREPVWI